jgi:hypothetical protein
MAAAFIHFHYYMIETEDEHVGFATTVGHHTAAPQVRRWIFAPQICLIRHTQPRNVATIVPPLIIRNQVPSIILWCHRKIGLAYGGGEANSLLSSSIHPSGFGTMETVFLQFVHTIPRLPQCCHSLYYLRG